MAERTANDVLAAASGISILVLETLRDVARLAPAPYLSVVSSTTLRILETVQEFKENEQGYKKLGADTCKSVYAITANCLRLTENNGALSADLMGNLEQLWRLTRLTKQLQSDITIYEVIEEQQQANRVRSTNDEPVEDQS
ncbi:hypothetical protein PQX77_010466 [Marasmius sp. AFHP31]|nr:hypothetical protein PQX77_010466 [Marasmius sp. AFHP31]